MNFQNLFSLNTLYISLITSLVLFTILNIVFSLTSFKKFSILNIISIVLLGCTILVGMANQKIYYLIIVISASYVFNICFTIQTIVLNHYNNLLRYSLANTTNNVSNDYFLLCNKKGEIINFSKSILEMVKYSKNSILNKNGIDTFFNLFNVEKVGNNIVNESSIKQIKKDLEVSLNNLIIYQQPCDIKYNNGTSHFYLFFRGVYDKLKLLGYTITIQQDRTELLEKLKDNIKVEKENNVMLLKAYKKVFDMSKDALCYYSYSEKQYYTNKAFRILTNTTAETYSFQELLSFMSEEDVNKYFEQSRNINNINIVVIKYQLKIENVVYNALEESINITSDPDSLVSIIHITRVTDESKTLSTIESVDLLNKLSQNTSNNKINNINNILDSILKVEEND